MTSTTTLARRAIVALATVLIALAAFAGTAGTAQAATCSHTYGDWTIDTLATYYDSGSAHRTCTKCGNVDTTVTLPYSYSGVTRIAGSTRYATAANIAYVGFDDSSCAVIATGKNFPDALSAASVAGRLNAPIILTDSSTLSPEAKDEIEELEAKNFYIVGGTSAISDEVEDELETYGGKIQRFDGANRYETSLKIFEEFDPGYYWSDGLAIVVTGADYPDALSISSYAYITGSPIFLANPKTGLDEATQQAIKDYKFEGILIIGGTNAVSAETEKWLDEHTSADIKRIAGANRYETSKKVAEYALASGWTTTNNACVTTGKNFPDALAGGALAGVNYSVLLLVDPGKEQALDVLKDSENPITNVYVLGGTNAVPETVKADIEKIVGMALDGSVDFTEVDIMSNADKGCDYTGEPVEISFGVYFGTRILVKDRDYTVTYSNNVEIGTATATITGIGRFSGTQTLNYKIHEHYTHSGSCGSGVRYTVNDDGVLTISGKGAMDTATDNRPYWYNRWTDEIKSVVVEEGVTSVGEVAFPDCTNLTSVTIASSVKSIGADAFEDCTNLSSVTIADNSELTSISYGAFEGCANLTSINFGANSKLESIGNGVFWDCTSLESIDLPSTVTSMGCNLFRGCTKLASISIPAGVTAIDTRTFMNCTNLSSVTIPSDSELASIKDSAFSGCSNLTAISIPTATTLGTDAFPSTCTVTRF